MEKKKLKEEVFYKNKYKDNWVLYSGMYEIHWKNGVADKVCIANTILDIKPFKPRQANKLIA